MPPNGQNPSDVRFRRAESPDDKNCQAAPPTPPSAWPALAACPVRQGVFGRFVSFGHSSPDRWGASVRPELCFGRHGGTAAISRPASLSASSWGAPRLRSQRTSPLLERACQAAVRAEVVDGQRRGRRRAQARPSRTISPLCSITRKNSAS